MEASQQLKVLVAEDDFVSRLLLQRLLSKWAEVHVAISGEEAVKAFTTQLDQGQSYDLVCLDFVMPGMNGKEALVKIRAAERKRGIEFPRGVKVIMTTALSDSKSVLSSFREGCEAYLVKPISSESIEATIRKLELI